MKKKGFTLVELLAVIVILAIIALIATPIILNVIKDSKESSTEVGVTNYMEHLEKEVLLDMVNNNNTTLKNGLYSITEKGISDGTNEIEVNIKGTTPKKGVVCVEKNGTVSKYSVEISGYTVEYNGFTQYMKKGESSKETLKCTNDSYVGEQVEGTTYTKGTVVSYNGEYYECVNDIPSSYANYTLDVINSGYNYLHYLPNYDPSNSKYTEIDPNFMGSTDGFSYNYVKSSQIGAGKVFYNKTNKNYIVTVVSQHPYGGSPLVSTVPAPESYNPYDSTTW